MDYSSIMGSLGGGGGGGGGGDTLATSSSNSNVFGSASAFNPELWLAALGLGALVLIVSFLLFAKN